MSEARQESIFDSVDERGRRMTQSMKILKYMLENGSITPVDAMKEFGVMRLAARISDLEGQGFDIAHERVTGRNRYGEPVSYSSYRLNGTGVKANG